MISFFPGDVVQLANAEWMVIQSNPTRTWISSPAKDDGEPHITYARTDGLKLVARSLRMTTERISVLLHMECVTANDSRRRAIVREMIGDIGGSHP